MKIFDNRYDESNFIFLPVHSENLSVQSPFSQVVMFSSAYMSSKQVKSTVVPWGTLINKKSSTFKHVHQTESAVSQQFL